MATGLVKTKVEVDVAGEQAAIGDVTKVRKELESASRQAQRTERDAQRTEARAVGILDRMKQRGILREGGINLGSSFKLTASGFGVREAAYKAGTTGLAAVAIAGTVEATLGGILRFREFMEAGADPAEARRALVGAVINGVPGVSMGQRIGSLVNQAILGESEAESASQYEHFWRFRGLLGGRHSADIERDRRNLQIYLRQAAAERDAANKETAEAKRRDAIDAAVMKAQEAADLTYERQVRGLKTLRNPVILPEPTFQLQRRLHMRRFDHERQEARNQAEQRKTQLLEQEGA